MEDEALPGLLGALWDPQPRRKFGVQREAVLEIEVAPLLAEDADGASADLAVRVPDCWADRHVRLGAQAACLGAQPIQCCTCLFHESGSAVTGGLQQHLLDSTLSKGLPVCFGLGEAGQDVRAEVVGVRLEGREEPAAQHLLDQSLALHRLRMARLPCPVNPGRVGMGVAQPAGVGALHCLPQLVLHRGALDLVVGGGG